MAAGVTAALMALPLAAGCEAAPPPASAEWQQPFDRLEHNWEVTRGLGHLGIRLTVLTGNQTFACDGEGLTANYAGIAVYCRNERTVVVAESRFQSVARAAVQRGGTVEAARAILLGHEIGHRVDERIRGKLVASKETELRADCLAGEGLEDSGETVRPADAEAFYAAASLKPDQDQKAANPHGIAAERLKYFELGSSKGIKGDSDGCGVRGHALHQDGSIEPGI